MKNENNSQTDNDPAVGSSDQVSQCETQNVQALLPPRRPGIIENLSSGKCGLQSLLGLFGVCNVVNGKIRVVTEFSINIRASKSYTPCGNQQAVQCLDSGAICFIWIMGMRAHVILWLTMLLGLKQFGLSR